MNCKKYLLSFALFCYASSMIMGMEGEIAPEAKNDNAFVTKQGESERTKNKVMIAPENAWYTVRRAVTRPGSLLDRVLYEGNMTKLYNHLRNENATDADHARIKNSVLPQLSRGQVASVRGSLKAEIDLKNPNMDKNLTKSLEGTSFYAKDTKNQYDIRVNPKSPFAVAEEEKKYLMWELDVTNRAINARKERLSKQTDPIEIEISHRVIQAGEYSKSFAEKGLAAVMKRLEELSRVSTESSAVEKRTE